jgi:hypothetical protein
MSDKKIHWLTPFKYAVPADYENWFEALALEGWHPVKVGQWSSIAMRFSKSEPKRYRYVVDMQAAPKKDYKRMYEEFGWEFVGQMASAMVWRREYDGERPESFSDTPSRRERNKRFFWAVSVSGFLFVAGALAAAGAALFAPLDAERRLELLLEAAFCMLAAVGLGAVMMRIRKNIDR